MNSDLIAAAILTAAFAQAQRQSLTLGVLDDSIREKFLEYLAFVRKQQKQPKAARKPKRKAEARAAGR